MRTSAVRFPFWSITLTCASRTYRLSPLTRKTLSEGLTLEQVSRVGNSSAVKVSFSKHRVEPNLVN